LHSCSLSFLSLSMFVARRWVFSNQQTPNPLLPRVHPEAHTSSDHLSPPPLLTLFPFCSRFRLSLSYRLTSSPDSPSSPRPFLPKKPFSPIWVGTPRVHQPSPPVSNPLPITFCAGVQNLVQRALPKNIPYNLDTNDLNVRCLFCQIISTMVKLLITYSFPPLPYGPCFPRISSPPAPFYICGFHFLLFSSSCWGPRPTIPFLFHSLALL